MGGEEAGGGEEEVELELEEEAVRRGADSLESSTGVEGGR